MRFTVTYQDGAWTFVIESVDAADPYHEEFTILDINEAKDTAWDLIEEISSEEESSNMDSIFDEDDE